MTETSERPPVRVLLGMPFADLLGGAERLLDIAMPRARAVGLDVHVVFFADGPLVERVSGHGLRTTVIPVARHNDPLLAIRTILRVRRLLVREDPQVVLSWLARAHVWLGPAALLAGRADRAVWWQHHIGRGERLETLVTAIPARCVVATSAAVSEAQGARRPRRRCVVVRPGIEPPTALPAHELDALRESLGIPPGRTVVGIVGRLVRWKGQDRFVRALGILRRDGHDVAGLVVGDSAYGIDDDYPAALREIAREAGVADRVLFTGHVREPLAHIALMDALVNATEGEPFGLTLLEAMAVGTPVLAVDRAGPTEIVESGRSGILVPDGRPESLAAGLAQLISQPDLRDRLADGGRARFRERFTAERMAVDMGDTLRALASR